ncbi:DEAD/DEAH box helicase [Aneurinibacillus aneurinilyticus]|uniref:DEAD/DEAH box helicase n=1 Tax=Aneurinibacillus aneurinilyticus TaxID=1391 RepID=UPI003523FD20
MTIFQSVKPFIEGNKALLKPQVAAYQAATSHYKESPHHKEVLIVMATGSGKTGLMSLLPFGLSKGKVLLVTPSKIIRKGVFQELDSISNPQDTFWYKYNVIVDRKKLPKSYLYKGWDSNSKTDRERTIEKLNSVDIVVTNVHKITGSSEEQALTSLVAQDFFDMIIVDEAHHVAADMWQGVLDYFNANKVIKLTATPSRGDGREISNNPYDPIYMYTLGAAVNDGLAKDISKKEEIPEKLEFYNKETGLYHSAEEARELLGDNWVNDTLLMSEDCSKTVIKHTVRALNEKRKSYRFHQVLAVACNHHHAQLLTKWFQEEGLKATYVSCHLGDPENERRLYDFGNHEYDVMVNIQMLGEGFDHPNISIISLFRPFKSLPSYAQVIGRGIRIIRHPEAKDIDNYCDLIYHKELRLEKLWENYKSEKYLAEIMERQTNIFDFFELGAVEKPPSLNPKSKKKNEPTGTIIFGDSIGQIHSYQSKGLGNEDTFSKEGLAKLRKAKTESAAAFELEHLEKLNDKKKHYESLLERGELNQEDYEFLISKAEREGQEEIDKQFDELKDLIEAERLRQDFQNWLRSRVMWLFENSSLDKDGTELCQEDIFSPNDSMSNIGYIIKNIRQSLFEISKKQIDAYTTGDYINAKDYVNKKIGYYLKQFPKK